MISVDDERVEVKAGRRKVLGLTPKEYGIAKNLKFADGRVLSRQYLLRKVWGYTREESLLANTGTVDQHIFRLRRKIRKISRPDSKLIVNVPQRGYKLIS